MKRLNHRSCPPGYQLDPNWDKLELEALTLVCIECGALVHRWKHKDHTTFHKGTS